MVYLWNKTGSLNNDINRPANSGVSTAKLKKKVISNLRYSDTSILEGTGIQSGSFLSAPQLFSSNEPTVVKLNNNIYMGNIDTLLNPDDTDGMYFVFNSSDPEYNKTGLEWILVGNISNKIEESNIKNDFISNSERWWKTFYDEIKSNAKSAEGTLYYKKNRSDSEWIKERTDFFKKYLDCAIKKDFVRMKYKSTPHLVFTKASDFSMNWEPVTKNSVSYPTLPIIEVRRDIDISDTSKIDALFGGTSSDALRENNWVPCGEPVSLDKKDANDNVNFYYEYGDTYYQRYDCLKTYAYTPEDENQVVEIGSFMLETRVNIDGRYDRNRGQLSNLNMSPRNFNLINPVYSQVDNFFTYKITDEDNYRNNTFPNQITWSKTKDNGADVDLWTNVTLASILELDGDKGKLNKLIRLNDQILAFQDTGISQLLYNENVQISSTDGVPIEIANSGKVQGKRYLSNTIGCSNKWSMATTPAGIYFMDSHDKSIYLFNGQLQNISAQLGFNSWCKKNIPDGSIKWNPANFGDERNGNFRAFYDKMNQDVLFINNNTALAYSEKLQAFTSFYSYEGSPFFCNLDDTGIWLRNYIDEHEEEDADTAPHMETDTEVSLWRHQAGKYCEFFGIKKPYWMTLVGNPEPQTDKIFTNLEFRACVENIRELNTFDTSYDGTFHPRKIENKLYLPFDYLETWDEYQHGITTLENKHGHSAMLHHTGDSSSLKRKFRIWRCDIPRDNVNAPEMDSERGISRYKKHPMDRMRNPWLYIKLMKEADEDNTKTEIHNIIMTYFN